MKHDIAFYEEEHTYLVDGNETPSVTTILSYLTDTEYGKVNPSVLEQAAKRGSLVHEYTEAIDYDCDPDEVEFEVAGYLKAYKQFIKDYKPLWRYVEQPVYSEMFDFVGTVDREGLINYRESVVDIKTIAAPTKLQKFVVSSQTEAYAIAIRETYGIRVEKRYALYLGKDGDYNLVDLDEYDEKYDYNSFAVFDACHKFYNQVQGIKAMKPIRKGKK